MVTAQPGGTPIAQKIEVRFAKRGALRFASHHDLMRLWHRAMRRAGLPVRLTQGFNPRPRVVFPTALELGVESEDEAVEVELTEWVPLARLRLALARELPEGIELVGARLLPPRRRGQLAVEATYRVTAPAGQALPVTREAVERFLAARSVPYHAVRGRRGAAPRERDLDLRREVRALALEGGALVMRLALSNEGSARPEEVLAVLAGRPADEMRGLRVTKIGMRLAPGAG